MNHHGKGPAPWRRLISMLHPERVHINYIFIYALLGGLISLSIPLGITAVFNLLLNGAIYSSTYILIAVVVIGVVIAGIMLISQLTLVEAIEQKIFTRTAMEFAYRLPRIRKSELDGSYPPELVNRFFDILTIQKGLSKFLVNIITSGVTMVFSVVLLAFYHPVFIAMGAFTLIIMTVIVVLYFRRGVNTSVQESAYKYNLVAYLESVAGDLDAHRNEESMGKIIQDTDRLNASYLRARNDHFRVLRKFFKSSVVIRTVMMGALLLLGSWFVVEREMTLGQFVAAEVIIVQIGYAIEKLFTSLDTIFDMVTGAEKLAAVTDLEIDEKHINHEAH
ncbi:ABC transporter ATP-binding protein [Terrimonas sp. NA20]|uniref:ABC transporter ATP-binding protein n=1 Tax=Terrimonas ginsenosidimutans TaxID=2908004 RepID=A0ABS9KWN1_9BACT|nr:ABC transporter transmembrane domain-containing protein [Terrimonas ginsenosidimutans]MCG2616730.1 ABC transporter ATP-binding protein [Terrimonas ginsenosidimutans]